VSQVESIVKERVMKQPEDVIKMNELAEELERIRRRLNSTPPSLKPGRAADDCPKAPDENRIVLTATPEEGLIRAERVRERVMDAEALDIETLRKIERDAAEEQALRAAEEGVSIATLFSDPKASEEEQGEKMEEEEGMAIQAEIDAAVAEGMPEAAATIFAIERNARRKTDEEFVHSMPELLAEMADQITVMVRKAQEGGWPDEVLMGAVAAVIAAYSADE
jgi:hypothetical protein